MKLTFEEIEKHVKQDKHQLDLSSCNITDDDISIICQYLKAHPNIVRLNLENNQISAIGTKELVRINSIKWLDIGVNHICDSGAQILANSTSINYLRVHENDIGKLGVGALARNCSITSLNICDNHLSDEGAKELAQNSTIKYLIIGNNEIGSLGAEALAQNTSIECLDIYDNTIGTQGMIALAQNTSIVSLNIWGNQAYVCVADFITALKDNTTLIKFNHDFKAMSATESIERILKRNRVLPWLNTIKYARLLSQAQRSDHCPLGSLPFELLGMIHSCIVGSNYVSFFKEQFFKRPSEEDLKRTKQFAML